MDCQGFLEPLHAALSLTVKETFPAEGGAFLLTPGVFFDSYSCWSEVGLLLFLS